MYDCRVPEVNRFISEVLAWQGELGLNDEEFARHLGITKGYWSLLRNGNRDGSLRAEKLVRAVGAKNPALLQHLLEEMAAK